MYYILEVTCPTLRITELVHDEQLWLKSIYIVFFFF